MNKLFTSSHEVAILERGPVDGRVVFFLHGFPDDATGFLPIMNMLADQGIRTFAPYMRGGAYDVSGRGNVAFGRYSISDGGCARDHGCA
ncbi:alpha/beta fold hydrolase [Sulfitobacter sp. 1A12157]|uniref:alpha/beta fold hydrolase n=1 Tax=Sulfitobacter sp. 1A12157 TaxID=3368594 RepID=UPI003745B919